MSEPPACGHSFRPLDVLAAIAMALVAASSERPSAKLPASAAPGGATRPVGRYRRARSEVSSARPIPRAGLVADDGGGQQPVPAQRRLFRQREQGRPYHHAVVRDAGRMHVFPNEAVSHHGIGEGGVGRRAELRRPDDGRAATALRDRDGLAAPGMVARLEGAGQEVEQTEFCFRDDLGPEISEIKREHAPRHLARERYLA